eukprot:UN00252
MIKQLTKTPKHLLLSTKSTIIEPNPNVTIRMYLSVCTIRIYFFNIPKSYSVMFKSFGDPIASILFVFQNNAPLSTLYIIAS